MYLTDLILENNKISHGFFGRQGGVSHGIYNSLSCGLNSGDDFNAVEENRHIVEKNMSVKKGCLLTLRQVHGNTCIDVMQSWNDAGPEADAMVTDLPGLALGILTADCAPVLFYGLAKGNRPVIAAAHAGWKGALNGIVENTIQTMIEKGVKAKTICACIGPCIGQESYEVTTDFCLPFVTHNEESAAFFRPLARDDDKFLFDLSGYVAWRLKGAGVQNVSAKGIDTCFNEEDYFSFRRATQRGEPDYGRQVSVIAIK